MELGPKRDQGRTSVNDPKNPNLKETYESIRELLARRIVGMDEVIRLLLTGIFSGGHCLLVGVPGLAKTKLIASLAQLMELDFSRIQFTPDLMPSDITGAEVIVDNKETGAREFRFLKGPIFAHIVLADEINRTPPKTQASLMEAMEERQVSSLGQRFKLEDPFFVLATQNPIEQEGTYPLPAAQLDRFIFSIKVGYPTATEEEGILRMTTRPHDDELKPVIGRDQVLRLIAQVRNSPVPKNIAEYATTLVRRTRPDEPSAPERIKKYVAFGAGPRAAQALVMGAKVVALMRGASAPTHADVRSLIRPVLCHRVVVNFLGVADNAGVEALIDDVIDSVPAPDYEPRREKKRGLLASLFARRG